MHRRGFGHVLSFETGMELPSQLAMPFRLKLWKIEVLVPVATKEDWSELRTSLDFASDLISEGLVETGVVVGHIFKE